MGNTEKFDFIANQYDTDERIKIAKVISDTIRSYVVNAKEKNAIDFGCGTGLIGIDLLDAFQSILFIDSSPNMIEQVKQKIEKLHIQNADALCYDFETESPSGLQTDYILASQVLLHIKDVESILLRLFNMLNEGGHLLIVDFNKNKAIESDEVHNGFEQGELIKVVKKLGFTKVHAKTFYHGSKIFMNKDASLFILNCEK